MNIEPFSIHVGDDVLSDLRARLRNARLPPAAPGAPWEQGFDRDELAALLRDWQQLDWRTREADLNRFHHFRADVGGVSIHFVHERAPGGGVPLVLTHGWPSAFIEYLPLVPLLTNPRAHGIEGPAFDVVIPSLPGYCFSQRPERANRRDVAALWHQLMQGLGYRRYGAAGGDFGAGVATFMALDQPGPMIGIHLSTPEVAPLLDAGAPLSPAERAFFEQQARWDDSERGYSHIQSTRPQTLGYALEDSPAGLAAWVGEKWRAWIDGGGALFDRGHLLTLLTLIWATRSITTSMRDYFDNRWRGAPLQPGDFVRVPTGVANFARQLAFEGEPPREYFARLYDVRRFTPMPRGGHFGAAEQPLLLARDIGAFFASL
ncbi:MAG TPA: epoxide hydrolase [Myxococcales bacterium]|nr:epoxide hydrolase [Myxococcales bacterium]